MNGPTASDNKLMLPFKTLALFIEMHQGLQKLAIHHKHKKDRYADDFKTDACEQKFYKVADYFVRNQKFIVKVRERLRIVPNQPDQPEEPAYYEEKKKEEKEEKYKSD